MKTAPLLVYFLIISSFVSAQNIFGLEGKISSGYLGVHRPSISHLPQDPVLAGELTYFIDLQDSNSWTKAYHRPRVGFTAFYSTTGNRDLLGDLFGTFAFGDLPFIKNKKNAFTARVGAGLAYVTKVYDLVSNPKNNAMSSHLNVIVQMSLNYRRSFEKTEIGFGVGLNHFSNGANKLPNLGLNYPMVNLTFGRIGSLVKSKSKPFYTDAWQAPWCFGSNFIFSVKEVFPSGGKKYPVFALNGFARKIFSPKLGVEIALDGIYKTAVLNYLPDFEKKPVNIFQLGFFAGHVLTFDRFSTILGMGYYFRDRYVPEDRIYHRIGMRYRFKSNVQIGITLKSNYGKADYVEWSVGYIFNRRKV